MGKARISGMRQVVWPLGLMLVMIGCAQEKKPVVLLVTNPIDLQRINEGVVVSRAQLPDRFQRGNLILRDESGREISSQQDDLDGDGVFDELYFQISLAPKETLAFKVAESSSHQPVVSSIRTVNDGGVLTVETPQGTLVTQGPEDLRFFLPGARYPAWSAGYSVPEPALRDVQARVLSQGALRVVLEQKALWRHPPEVYIFSHRFSLAVNDPLVRSTIQKTRWPDGKGAGMFAFEVKSGNHRARTFSTRWLFFGEGAQVTPWNAAVLFKAAELLQAKPVAVNKGSCRHAFAGEASGIGVAWMVNAQESGSFQEVDRQAERSQQRWLNPIDVFVSE